LRYDAPDLELARDNSSRRQVELEIGRLPEDPDAIDFGKPEAEDPAAPAEAATPASSGATP